MAPPRSSNGCRRSPSALSQLDVGYGEPGSSKGGPRKGERAPDAPICRGRNVFDLLAGYGVTALALSQRRLDADEVDRLAEALDALPGITPHIAARLNLPAHPRVERVERSELFDAYGLTAHDAQALLLVRPDGFVGWRSDTLDPAACRTALAGLRHQSH